jgi:hypothetical protein
MPDPRNAEYQRTWRERQARRLPPVQRQVCTACPRLHTGAHGTLCWRCWRRLTPEGRRYVADSTARSKANRKAAMPPAIALLAALLVTGCSGSHWALPDPGARRAPRLLRTTTPSPSQLISTDHQAPPEVPGPAGLPVVLAAWWWSRRLRDCDRP